MVQYGMTTAPNGPAVGVGTPPPGLLLLLPTLLAGDVRDGAVSGTAGGGNDGPGTAATAAAAALDDCADSAGLALAAVTTDPSLPSSTLGHQLAGLGGGTLATDVCDAVGAAARLTGYTSPYPPPLQLPLPPPADDRPASWYCCNAAAAAAAAAPGPPSPLLL